MHVLAINGFPTDKQVVLTQDNTILRADLSEPIQPKGSITFRIKFKTYYGDGTIRRRMKSFDSYGYKHYDITHWYPRIAVYDKNSDGQQISISVVNFMVIMDLMK